MNPYQKTYNQIIEKAKIRELSGYKERHHIIPKCMGGSNDKKNKINLTAKEHYYCHKLLTKIYPDNKKIWYAFWAMCNLEDKNQQRYQVSAEEYELARKRWVEIVSKESKERQIWNKGKKDCFSEETNKKFSEKMKERWKDLKYREKIIKSLEIALNKEECKEKISEKSKLMWKNPEHRKKMSIKSKELWKDPEYRRKCTFNLVGNQYAKGNQNRKGCKLPEEQIEKMRKRMTGNVPWNKGIKQKDYKKKINK